MFFSVGFYMNDFKTLPITFLDASNTFYFHNVFTYFLEICIPPKYTGAMISNDNWLYFFVNYYKNSKLDFHIPVPEKLRTFLMRSSNLKYQILNFSFSRNELQSLSFSGNVLHTCIGSVNNVKNMISLDLSSNFCSNVSTTFFSQDFNNLKQLLLQNNLLGLVIPKDIEGDILQNLKSVDHINLSKNRIVHLPKQFFKSQKK